MTHCHIYSMSPCQLRCHRKVHLVATPLDCREQCASSKRYGSSRFDDKLHPPSGASTTCRSAMVECRSTAGSRANGTRFLLASLQLQACRCAPLPTSFTSLQGGGLPPRRVQPGPTRPCCAAPSPPARSGCLCGTLIAARASNSPSRCAGR